MFTPEQLFFMGILAVSVLGSYFRGLAHGVEKGCTFGMQILIDFMKFKAGEEQVDQWIENDSVNLELWLRRQHKDE